MSDSNANNAWIVQESGFKPVPPGMYLATFKGVQTRDLSDGPKWRWEFTVTSGENSGAVASALTAQKISVGSHAGRLITGLIGRDLKAGDNMKSLVDGCVGKPYMVSVQPGPKGGKPSVQSLGKPPTM